MHNEASLYKSNAAIDKTSAANAWNHYQAKSNKQNLAELATHIPGVDQTRYRLEVDRYRFEKEEIRKEAERWEASSSEWNLKSEQALHRHHQWTLASVIQQIAISLAAVALLARWPRCSSVSGRAAGGNSLPGVLMCATPGRIPLI
jgi:hypothetical protein